MKGNGTKGMETNGNSESHPLQVHPNFAVMLQTWNHGAMVAILWPWCLNIKVTISESLSDRKSEVL